MIKTKGIKNENILNWRCCSADTSKMEYGKYSFQRKIVNEYILYHFSFGYLV